MKTLFKNLVILALLVSPIISCDELEDLADFKKDIVLTEYFTVDLEGNSEGIETIDLNISILTAAIEPYADKLKEIEIQKITFEIVDYNGDAAAEFEVQFTADGTLFINESFVASEADTNNTIFEATNSQGLNSLATKLLNNNTVTISFSAESTNLENSAYFRVETKFYIGVTANPL